MDHVKFVARRRKRFQQFGRMIAAARFHGDIDGGFVQAHAIVRAVIRGLHDIGARLGNNRRQPLQRAGIVRQQHAQAQAPSIPHHPLLDNSRQQIDVKIAAGHQHCDVLTAIPHFILEDSGQRHGARPFRHGFLALQQYQNRFRDVGLIDGHDPIDIPAHERQCALASPPNGDPVRQRRFCGKIDRAPVLQRRLHRRQARGLDADHLNLSTAPFDRAADAANQPAPSDRHDNHVQLRILLEKLQPDGSLPRNHVIVIEGMDERGPSLHTPLDRRLAGFVIAVSVQDDIGTIATGRGQFNQGRHPRHPDLGWNIALGRMIGHTLPVVACRRRDDSLPTLGLRHGQNAIQRAALLERSGHLQVFQLQENCIPRQPGQHFRVHQRRLVDRRSDPDSGGFDRFRIHHDPALLFICISLFVLRAGHKKAPGGIESARGRLLHRYRSRGRRAQAEATIIIAARLIPILCRMLFIVSQPAAVYCSLLAIYSTHHQAYQASSRYELSPPSQITFPNVSLPQTFLILL
ncbi:hypothetical protein NITLEN_100015 [Nitrospira lenta]|uniref:Uncharacterized protein n=1 Tax=Nitrospira lenta TaxID=1436998 RepID=A0A330L498_9BACT|nr:hypothetical protein NITLEN_100015 [Nitrospira lenta]